MRPKHTETAIVEGETAEIGRDPRKMTEAELIELGHQKRPLLRAIRANCIECAGGSEAEVRRCRMVACPMWPYRMSTNPFHKQTLSDDRKAELVERLAKVRGMRDANSD